jgi:tetratricopeptide (TPR) repeat protein
LANLGFLALERADQVEAERLLRRALELDRDNYPAMYDLGRLLIRGRRYDEALTFLKRGAELAPDDPGVHYQLFLVYSRAKQKPDADRELALFKKLEEARKANQGGMMGSATNETPVVPDSLRSPPTAPVKDKP